jgi:hypothetical protein
VQSLEMSQVVTVASDDEAAYLASDPDIAEALAASNLETGRRAWTSRPAANFCRFASAN